MNRFLRVTIWGCLLLMGWASSAQQSTNVVDYLLTYDAATARYTAWVVPRYNVPNSNNTSISGAERGGTAQFTIKVPSSFVITNIVDVNGVWDKSSTRLGPGNPGQESFWSSQLDPNVNYYAIGKAASETNYGIFASGVPVRLFTFQGNGCLGPLAVLEAGNLFITEANNIGLNVANSFYSISGTPPGGNQTPLEQFRNATGNDALCAIPAGVTASPDSQTLTAGTTTTIPVLANDTSNGQPASTTSVTVSISTPPTTGTATVNPNGTVSFTPAPGFTGPVSFTYTICDLVQTAVCASAPVSLTVNPVPVVLVTNPDNQTLTAGIPTTIPVLANDTRNGQPVSISAVTLTVTTPVSGTATVNPDGTVTYTPAPGYTGPVSFTYTVCDISQPTVCSSSPISLTVNPAPVVLVANPDKQTLTAGLTTTIPVLANDTYNGTPASITNVTVSISTPPAAGTATVNPDGTISFTPAPGFTGPISFTYTACAITQPTACVSGPISLTVNPVPTVLTANPDSQTLTAGVATTIPVLANDFNNGQPASTTSVTVSISTPPTTGTATVNPDGTVTYTPSPGYTGPVSFTYTICDLVQTAVCASAPVSLTVNPVPVVLVTNPDSQTLTAGIPTTIPVLANDTRNGQPVSISAVTLTVTTPVSGTVTVNPDGTVTYTPAPGYTGPVSFTYTVCDISQPTVCSSSPISLTVNPAPVVLVANPDKQTLTAGLTTTIPVLANDTYNGTPASTTNVTVSISTPPAAGTATVNPDGTISFTPAPGSTGPISFTYTACAITQPTVCVSGPISLTVNPVPTVLTANPDSQTLTAGLPTTIPVLANDFNNGSPASTTSVTVSISTPPATGTATVNPNGTVSFTPAPGFTGPVSFTYTICDLVQTTVCASAPVSLTVNPVPVVLVTNPDNQTLTAGIPTTIPVLANDTRNGQPVSISAVTLTVTTPVSGTATVNPDGTVTYTPAPGYTGPISFTYTVCDISQPTVCSSSPISLTVNPAPVVLVANPDKQTLTAGLTTTIPVLANDTYNGTPASTTNVTVSISTPPAAGTATVNPDGTISFTPAPGFTGPISFTYTACAITQPTVCVSGPISLTVNPVPTVLTANPDSQTLTAGVATTIPVLANDFNNGQPASTTSVTVSISTPPTTGTATVNPNGTIGFTPAPGFTGPVSFTYTICDLVQPTVCASAPISLTVNPAPNQSADLLITKKVSQAGSAVGDVVSFTITVQNMGPGSAVGVTVTDTLLRNSTVQVQGTPTVSKGSFNAATGLWTVGDLTANETVTFVLSVRLLSQGVVVNVASVTATGSQDPNETNNMASACTSVPYVLCSGESLTVSVPREYQNVQWYRNGNPTAVFTGNTVTIDLPGTYTVSSSNGSCPIAGCCPIVIQQGACCPPDACVPFVIKKTKSRL